MSEITDNIILALPKGRILQEIIPFLKKWNIKIEQSFFDDKTRQLIFSTNFSELKVIKCRSFDIATFVSYQAADIAICGLDVIEEFSYQNIYNILDLGIGKCRLSMAGRKDFNLSNLTHNKLVVATKYVNLATKYFHNHAIQTEIIKLNGAIEVAANLNICDYIVDLVSTGNTLKANNLEEIEILLPITSRVIVNKSSLVTRNELINKFLKIFQNG
jgi:ATP phosphoribosyltransferase